MKLSPIISNQSGCMTCKETLSCLADEGLSLFRLFFFGAFLPFNSKSKYCETKTDLTPKHIRLESLSIPSKLKSPLQTRWSLINSLELECSSGNHLACKQNGLRVESYVIVVIVWRLWQGLSRLDLLQHISNASEIQTCLSAAN